MPNWKKIKDLRFNELRVRSSQLLAALGERGGWSSLAKLPVGDQLFALFGEKEIRSESELREHFRTRSTPKFFAGFETNAGVEEFRRHWPEAERRILDRANRIVAGHFDLLGFHDLSFGDPIDWALEPVAGKRVPALHWSKLDYLDAGVAGDKKIVWELNRHQYFATLGQSYWLSGDERYAQTFSRHLESWMDQNPPKQGINWASSLEIAFRSISWLWGFYFFKNSPSFSPSTFARALRFLYLHARHLETYLSTYFSPNTHLTGEALGLFYLGLLLPDFKEARRWRQTGTRILLEQLPIHVRPDGVYFEQSSYYHRYTTDFFIHFLILSLANGEAVPEEVRNRLTVLLDHLMYITRPDGTTPLFGDDDGGRLMKLDHRAANDFRATLSTGAALYGRPDFKFVAAELAEETFWLLGTAGVQTFDHLIAKEPTRQSVAFESGGYYVMRDGWTKDSNYLLFDCGPHGASNCGHAHADALAFELAANGCTLLVDPGTYTYTGSPAVRDWFRSSAAHNTLTVDGESSSVSAGPFSWRTIAPSKRVSWITQQRFDYVVGKHEGFDRLADGATHTRSILFLKHNYWVVRDHVAGQRSHQLKLWFHFDSSVVPLSGNKNEVYVEGEDGLATRLLIATFAPGGTWTEESGWVSSCYGGREEALVFAYSVLGNGSEELVTFLLPEALGAHHRPVVKELEATEGRAFEIRIGEQHDVLLIRDPDHFAACVQTARLLSDFELTWARFANNRAQMPDQLVLIGGQLLEFEGREILKAGKRIDFLSLSIEGDQVRRESEAGIVDLSLPVAGLESLFADLNHTQRSN